MPSFFSKRKRPVYGDVPSELKGQASGQRRIVVWAKRLIGLALLAYVLGTAEWEQVWVHITKPNWYGMVLLFLAPVLLIGTSAAKWWLLLRVKGVHLSFWMAFQLYMVGMFFQNLIPSSFGGDVVRIAIAARRTGDTKVAAASTVVERLLGMMVLILLTVLIVVFTPEFHNHRPLMGAVLISVLFFFISVVLILSPMLTRPLAMLSRRSPLMVRVMEKIEQFQTAVLSYVGHPGAVVAGLALSVMFYASAILTITLACIAIGQPLPVGAVALTVPPVLLVSALPITLNGLGLREWAQGAAFGALGLLPSVGIAASLLFRMVFLIWSAIGYIFFLLIDSTQQETTTPREENRTP